MKNRSLLNTRIFCVYFIDLNPKSNINKELYRNLCDKLLQKYNIKNDEKEFAFAYFNYGVLAIIDKWVESDCEEDVYKIADLIIKLISL